MKFWCILSFTSKKSSKLRELRNKLNKKRPDTAIKQHLRIIGGKWRSRKIYFSPAEGLRPTGARLRETLFNWLSPTIEGAHCLDVFSGSGILALEALSRGAKSSTALENNACAVKELKVNRTTLSAALHIIAVDSLDYLAGENRQAPFDIVFVDPPFSRHWHTHICNLLETNGWLATNAIIYCELAIDDKSFSAPLNWQLHRDKRAGDVRYLLYYRIESAS